MSRQSRHGRFFSRKRRTRQATTAYRRNVSYSRVPRFERLEKRHVLSGTTIVTHGFLIGDDPDDTLPVWVDSMADEISQVAFEHAVVPGQPTKSTGQYEMTLTYSQNQVPDVTDWSYNNSYSPGVGISAFNLSSLEQSNGEAVIVLNWSAIAAPGEATTQTIAQKASEFLLTGLGELGTALLASPIHLVGHSRGASVVGALAEALGEHGISVDQVTYLDTHPLAFPEDWGNDDIGATENIVFADSYYREGGFFAPNGEEVDGAYNSVLQDSVTDGEGYEDSFGPHSDVHLWYHGTIDTEGAIFDGDAALTAAEASAWYESSNGMPGPRNGTGYYFSRVVGGTRTGGGLHPDISGGFGSRDVVSLTGEAWSNVVDFQLDATGNVFTVGAVVPFEYYTQDRDDTAFIDFLLDNDRNPFNNPPGTLFDQTFIDVGEGFTQETLDWNTAGQAAGSYFVYARAYDDDGHERFTYAPQQIILNAPPAPEIRVENLTNGGELIDGLSTLNFGSVQQGQAGPSKQLRVHNDGNFTLFLQSPTIPNGFVVSGLVTSIGAGSFDDFTIQLDTANIGTKSGTLSFGNDDSNENPFDIGLSGVVTGIPAPEIRVENLTNGGNVVDGVTTLSFGSALQGQAGPVKQLRVYNDGDATLTRSSLSVPSGYFVNGLASSIPAGTFDDFTIQLDTASLGSKSGNLSFGNNDSNENPFDIGLSGLVVAHNGAEIRLENVTDSTEIIDGTSVINFGQVELGGADSVKIFRLYNDGSSVLNLGSPTRPSEFVFNSFPSSVAPGAFDEFTIRLESDNLLGSYSGTASFTTNDSDENPFNFVVAGEITSFSGDEIRLVNIIDNEELFDGVSTVDFGTLELGADQSFYAKHIRIYNDGDSALQLGPPSVPSGFIVQGFDNSVQPGSFQSFSIQINTASAGTKSGILSFVNSDSNESPFEINLTGTIFVTPSPEVRVQDLSTGANVVDGLYTIDFGSVPQGATWPTRPLRIYNDGNATLDIGFFSHPSDFGVIGLNIFNIPAGSFHDFSIALFTNIVGTKSGTFYFNNNDSNEHPFEINLMGEVNAPDPPDLLGDYNQNGTVDAGDYVIWRKTLGNNVANYSNADGSGNGNIGPEDLDIWSANFGNTLPGAGSGAVVGDTQPEVGSAAAVVESPDPALVGQATTSLDADQLPDVTKAAADATVDASGPRATANLSILAANSVRARTAGLRQEGAHSRAAGSPHDAALLASLSQAWDGELAANDFSDRVDSRASYVESFDDAFSGVDVDFARFKLLTRAASRLKALR